eukprot:symbB.v1.2.023054.t1/scaffold1955.1/size113466/6
MRPPAHIAVLRVFVGLLGVAVLLLLFAFPLHVVKDVRMEDGRKGALKVALILLLCFLAPVWVFLVSQLLLEEVGLGCDVPVVPPLLPNKAPRRAPGGK